MSDRYLFIPITKTAISDDKSKTAKPVGTQYYIPTYYPNITVTEQDTYIITKGTDRLDLIANDFYGDSTLWWVLAMANDLPGDSIFVGDGIQLRIPANLSLALAEFNRVNSTSL
jgi:nucleoid-associated protein YgaU